MRHDVDCLLQVTLGTSLVGEAVSLRISDNGTGMSEDVRQRCLEPFFTTKGKRGTGLGLSMVYGITHRHGGTIDIESEEGKGTTFTIYLPLTNLTEAGISPSKHSPHETG